MNLLTFVVNKEEEKMFEFLIFVFSNFWRAIGFMFCLSILLDSIVEIVKILKGDKKEKVVFTDKEEKPYIDVEYEEQFKK